MKPMEERTVKEFISATGASVAGLVDAGLDVVGSGLDVVGSGLDVVGSGLDVVGSGLHVGSVAKYIFHAATS